ncbi:MAG: AAA family ATPase [Candidatus Electrothrix scaldis]|nr:MAG: AAA family ATPase [Candidatus Electrothrix sp. GW3-3]
MQKLPIGKQEFKGLIQGGFIYVDKTQHLLSLAQSTVPIFLSRPRRFGKSLMINTFKELFKGEKELFQNTYAYNNWDFQQTHPVIRLDLSKAGGDDVEVIASKLLELIYNAAEDLDIHIRETPHPDIAFDRLIRKAGKSTPAVLLIDEYDAPVLNNLNKPELPAIKELLREFYKIIKADEEYIRFIFITGISKFTQMGVFSALNHLNDITLNEEYAGCCGYTADEIASAFAEQIQEIRKKQHLTESEFWEKLSSYYNGYSWDGETFMYNPFSILKYFDNKGRLIPYWMETGSPEYIIRYSANKKYDLVDFEQIKVSPSFLSKRDIDQATPESFLTQAGYLTIKKREEESYTLDFPNDEVRRSFCELILNAQYTVADADILGVQDGLRKALQEKDIEKIIGQFQIIYSSIPYVHFDANKTEHFYSATLLMYLQAAGFDASPERLGNKGRLDLSLCHEQCVYIFELKTESAQKALRQIKEKNYAGAYRNRQVILVGLRIDFSERNIVQYDVERL